MNVKKIAIGGCAFFFIFLIWNTVVNYQDERPDIKIQNEENIKIVESLLPAEGLEITSVHKGTVGSTPLISYKYEGKKDYKYYEEHYSNQLEKLGWKLSKQSRGSKDVYKEYRKDDLRFSLECDRKEEGYTYVGLAIMGKPTW